ncbi:hypothetical protein WA026_015622 [Henosepilachna vigintioctopunctata]|uniref:N-alpha-acetyltransferase 15, NatA auxiliary subunit n=1 Tax=Henosepilachna vigintioctopunctata TaxID=420089 RepID=A0AAW1VEA9_9CUCU
MQRTKQENLAPSELKKLRNKQRKAKRKAEQESAQAKEAQIKRDQHHKSRQQGDVEADAPQLDELVPEKLERTEKPLEQAIKFLHPLQTLAKDRIETHLMAFEVYYRKGKVLLMLQSLKRCHRLDPRNPRLHSCMIRFHEVCTKNKGGWDPSVVKVVEKETKEFFRNRDAKTLNKEFLEERCNCLEATLEGASMMFHLDKESQNAAINLVTSLDNNKYNDINLKNCTNVLQALRKGAFGSCDAQIEEYVNECQKRFPYAATFKPPVVESTTQPAALDSNHMSLDENSNSN